MLSSVVLLFFCGGEVGGDDRLFAVVDFVLDDDGELGLDLFFRFVTVTHGPS